MDGSVHSAGGVRKGSIMAHGEREEMAAAEGGAIDAACEPKPKMPLLLKVFGVLCIVGGAVSIPSGVLAVVIIVQFLQSGGLAEEALTPLAVTVVLVLAQAAMLVLFILLGVRLLRNKRRYAALTAEVLMALAAVALVCNIMLNGTDVHIVPTLVILALLFFVSGYVDPLLSEERELQRKLRDMETRDQAEEGTLGLDSTGRGYIALNFFNVFWIFVVCSVLGLIIEVVYHFVIVVPGEYQDRAGMLFGPFSPIYGVGAVLMTMALNRFHDKPVPVIFLVSAVIGGAFEFFVSWFMETAFGAVAWDYTGTFLSIDGRTNGMFMAMWGMLGVLWIKALLPKMLDVVNLIPWKLRYTVTAIATALMLVNAIMTLQSLDCWYGRLSGHVPETPIEQFYATYFDNDFMANRFESMTINPDSATRGSGAPSDGAAG